jgi:hypothetical protein
MYVIKAIPARLLGGTWPKRVGNQRKPPIFRRLHTLDLCATIPARNTAHTLAHFPSGFDPHNRYAFFVREAKRDWPNTWPGHALRAAA